ncbi:MAG TPA: helix-turn-helix domain-containing protein, partial [Acidothermaceae bacterium]
MTNDSLRFHWERCVRRLPLTPTQKLVAFTVAQYADRDGGNIFPGIQLLARVTCLDPKTVTAALKELRDEGLLERTFVGGQACGRKGLADKYQLAVPVDLPDRDGLLTPDEKYPDGWVPPKRRARTARTVGTAPIDRVVDNDESMGTAPID